MKLKLSTGIIMVTPNKLSQKQVFSCTVFTVDEERYQGDAGEFTRYSVRHPGAAVFLPVTSDGKLLLVKQYRASIGVSLLEAPAGTLDPNESPLECAKREIQEEVDMKAEEWTDLGELYPAPGFCDEKQYLFLAKGLSPSSLPGDEDEDIEVVEISASEVEQAIAEGAILDGKTIALFARAKWRSLIS